MAAPRGRAHFRADRARPAPAPAPAPSTGRRRTDASRLSRTLTVLTVIDPPTLELSRRHSLVPSTVQRTAPLSSESAVLNRTTLEVRLSDLRTYSGRDSARSFQGGSASGSGVSCAAGRCRVGHATRRLVRGRGRPAAVDAAGSSQPRADRSRLIRCETRPGTLPHPQDATVRRGSAYSSYVRL